jgi:hypothetical protein
MKLCDVWDLLLNNTGGTGADGEGLAMDWQVYQH